VGAAEIPEPRDNHTGVGDRLLKRCEMDAWIAGRVMGEGRQPIAIGLRNVLSRDSATRSRQRRLGRKGDTCLATIRGARGDAFRTGLLRLFKNVDPFRKPQAAFLESNLNRALGRTTPAEDDEWSDRGGSDRGNQDGEQGRDAEDSECTQVGADVSREDLIDIGQAHR
jgi:hypothetical protein